MLLNDVELRRHCMAPSLYWMGRPLITPFQECKQQNVISYGVTHAGYDLTVDREVWVYKKTRGNIVVSPKRFKQDEAYRRSLFDIYEAEGSSIIVPGNSYVLVTSVEYMSVPPYLKGHCVGKSTFARCGIIVNTTPLEPGWHGKLTIEISNTNPNDVELYVHEGIAQLEFYQLIAPSSITYEDKGGKYQGQMSVTPPRVK